MNITPHFFKPDEEKKDMKLPIENEYILNHLRKVNSQKCNIMTTINQKRVEKSSSSKDNFKIILFGDVS
jgi:hypothetical protein